MARGFVRRTPVRAVQRRARVWDGNVLPLVQIAGGQSAFSILITEANLDAKDKPTIVRIRGLLHIAMDRSAEVAEDKAVITYGIGLMEGRAVTVGIASLPKPATDSEWGWMWIGSSTIATPTTLTEDEGGARFQRTVIDSKSMRKAGPGEVLVLVTEVTSITGTPDVECWGFFRILLLPS